MRTSEGARRAFASLMLRVSSQLQVVMPADGWIAEVFRAARTL